ncbi:hypothetical protein VTK26DRAFT_9244 [Humicola hyalothermophila]
MGSAGDDTFKFIQNTLEPYLRPREEVARIRQILAAHLHSCLNDASSAGCLALVDTDSPSSSSTARGLQKEYLEALNANIKARKEFAACRRERGDYRPKTPTAGSQASSRVEEHLTAVRLRMKHERLQAIDKSLTLLAQKAAASPGFLNPEQIFRDSRPLPQVPKELLTAITLGETAQGPPLKELNDQLEKHVLRTRLLLRREEQLLEKVKSRSAARPDNIPASAKFDALNKTRTELINWIEAELSKASEEDADAETQNGQKQRASTAPVNLEEQLTSIKEKYNHYLEARNNLLELVSSQQQPVIKPPAEAKQPPAAQPPTPAAPVAHLLAPYLERLLSIAREQKGLIAEKSHLNGLVTRQLKENNQILDLLAEESHLLPTYPMPGTPQHDAAFADAITAAGRSGPSSRVKPWVSAAESAKISTLEAVAEKIEEGQIALEGSMKSLGEIDELLRPGVEKKEDEEGATSEEDLWLAEGRSPGKAAVTRKHTSRKADKSPQPKTVWDTLDGKLGLLRSDDGTP